MEVGSAEFAAVVKVGNAEPAVAVVLVNVSDVVFVAVLIWQCAGQEEGGAFEKDANHWQEVFPDSVHVALENVILGLAGHEFGGHEDPWTWQHPDEEKHLGEAGMEEAVSPVYCLMKVVGIAAHEDVLDDHGYDGIVEELVLEDAV